MSEKITTGPITSSVETDEHVRLPAEKNAITDKDSGPLKVGDKVWVQCKVTKLHPEFPRNNVTLEVIDESDGAHKPVFSATSHTQVKKAK